MLRPAGSVALYLPKRSTMPARACGTIWTVFASSMITKMTTSNSRIRITRGTRLSLSFAELGDWMDVRRRAADLEDLHSGAGFDREVLVVRRCRPGLPRQLDLADREAGHPLRHDPA